MSTRRLGKSAAGTGWTLPTPLGDSGQHRRVGRRAELAREHVALLRAREEDVEEVDVDKLKAMVNVKDEDIQALDKFVTREGAAR